MAFSIAFSEGVGGVGIGVMVMVCFRLNVGLQSHEWRNFSELSDAFHSFRRSNYNLNYSFHYKIFFIAFLHCSASLPVIRRMPLARAIPLCRAISNVPGVRRRLVTFEPSTFIGNVKMLNELAVFLVDVIKNGNFLINKLKFHNKFQWNFVFWI